MLIHIKEDHNSYYSQRFFEETYVLIDKLPKNLILDIAWWTFDIKNHCDIMNEKWTYKYIYDYTDKNIIYKDNKITVFRKKPSLINFNIDIVLL